MSCILPKFQLGALFFFLYSCSSIQKTNEPQIISLQKNFSSLNRTKIFDKVVMSVPAFSIHQYHPGLKDLYSKSGTSNLCMPAVMSTVLIQKYIEDEKYKSLMLDGIDKTNSTVDGNAVVRQLLPCLKQNAKTGTNTRKSAYCLRRLATESSIEMDIKIISIPDSATRLQENITQVERRPELTDIKKYMDEGYQIIAGVDFFHENQDDTLKSDTGHYIAINGYAYRNNWPHDFLHVYVTDPTFRFWESSPKTHIALFMKNPNLKLPSWTTDISIQSPTLDSLKYKVFLTELLIFK